MPNENPVSINEAFKQVKCLKGRTPETTDEESADSFSMLSSYRDGGVFIAHYSGYSEWERHENGDEFVQIIEGETTLVLLLDDKEIRHNLREGELLVVPKNIWHRFESPEPVKVLTITPQPTTHSVDRPESN